MDDKEVINPKRGYLKEDFRMFHLKDQKETQLEFHSHDFNKIIFFISGKVTYLIEGKSYKLKPWDILLVDSSQIHRPLIDTSETYERIVLWVNRRFIESHNSADCNLLTCFELAIASKHNLLRLNGDVLKNVRSLLSQLEETNMNSEFGCNILRNSLFLQLIVNLNRLYFKYDKNLELNDVEFDETIGAIINYINDHLSENLSIDILASKFFMSKYYLMHKFKLQTGYSVHNYILQKRLMMANTLIKEGKPITEVSIDCGFGDYSSFIRAFKKMFGESPKKHSKLTS